MTDEEAARYLGVERERMRRAVLALKVPPPGHAYRRLRPYNIGALDELERFVCDPIVHTSGSTFVFRCERHGPLRYRVIDVCGLQFADFGRRREAVACADEYGPLSDELFKRAAKGDEKAAAALAAIARKHLERARG